MKSFAIIGFFLLLVACDPNAMVESASKELAKSEVRLRLSDLNPTFENMIYREPKAEDTGKPYPIVCGRVRTSNAPSRPLNFAYAVDKKYLALQGSNSEANAIIPRLCP